jgi:hypothetical protein
MTISKEHLILSRFIHNSHDCKITVVIPTPGDIVVASLRMKLLTQTENEKDGQGRVKTNLFARNIIPWMSGSSGSNIHDGTCLSTGSGIDSEPVGAYVGIGAVTSEVSDGPAEPVGPVGVSSEESRSGDGACEESGSCKDGLELHLEL